MPDTGPDPRVVAALETLGAPFEVLPCDPELADTAAFCAAYDIPLERSVNTIVVASRRPEGVHVACGVLATTRLDVNGVVRQRMGVKKASFASAEDTIRWTGMAVGGVTLFGLPTGMPVWVDAGVMEPDWIVIGAGTRSAKVKLSPEVLAVLPYLEIIPGLAVPSQGRGAEPHDSPAEAERHSRPVR